MIPFIVYCVPEFEASLAAMRSSYVFYCYSVPSFFTV